MGGLLTKTFLRSPIWDFAKLRQALVDLGEQKQSERRRAQPLHPFTIHDERWGTGNSKPGRENAILRDRGHHSWRVETIGEPQQVWQVSKMRD